MSISVAATSTPAASSQLVKLANGEYTADSVAKDPTDATKLNLVKERDGNYGTTAPAPTENSAAVQSSSNVLATVTSLKLGGK
jgi:hypothetical protein